MYESGNMDRMNMENVRRPQEMYRRSRECYQTIAGKYGIGLIPCGDVIQNIRKHPEVDVENGGRSICRDGFHMHYLYGRYALACTWAAKMLDAPITDCGYIPKCAESDEEADDKLIAYVREEVSSTV